MNVVVIGKGIFKQAHPNFNEIVEQYGKDYVMQVPTMAASLLQTIR